jgi:hypothetical protein
MSRTSSAGSRFSCGSSRPTFSPFLVDLPDSTLVPGSGLPGVAKSSGSGRSTPHRRTPSGQHGYSRYDPRAPAFRFISAVDGEQPWSAESTPLSRLNSAGDAVTSLASSEVPSLASSLLSSLDWDTSRSVSRLTSAVSNVSGFASRPRSVALSHTASASLSRVSSVSICAAMAEVALTLTPVVVSAPVMLRRGTRVRHQATFSLS